MKRLFVGIPLHSTSVKGVLEFSQQLKETGGDFQFVSIKNLHLTISFLGNVPEEKVSFVVQSLRSALAAQKKIVVELAGVGSFPNEQRINVVWIGVKDSVLVDLVKKINTVLLIKSGHAEEVPHLTIARVKSGKNKERIKEVIKKFKDTEFDSFVADKVVLYSSILTPEGPVYTIIKRYRLLDG